MRIATILVFVLTFLIQPALSSAAPRMSSESTPTPLTQESATNSPVLQSLAIPALLTHGMPFMVTATWAGDLAPADGPREVVYRLHRSDMSVAIELVSLTDLSSVLQGNATVTDEFWVSTEVLEGQYTISVLVRDPLAEQSPLLLDMPAVQEDGSYLVGTTSVQAAILPAAAEYTTYLPLAASDPIDGQSSRAVVITVSGVENNAILRGLVYIRAITDDSVDRVEFRLSGAQSMFWEEGGSPWWFLGNVGTEANGWNTVESPDGQYTLTFTAITNDGSRTSTQRTFSVDNVSTTAPTPAPTGIRTTFYPRQIPLSSPEIVNPMRGLYRWNNQEFAPQPIPARDSYERYTWRELEPTQGNYRFAALEADIALAASQGRKFSFRVRSVVANKGASIPDYAMTSRGWWEDYNNDGTRDTYVPDWNSDTFLSRMNTFMQALGNRYDGDPRVGLIDIGMYGNWGEWHMASFSYPSPTDAQRISTTNKYRIVDMHIASFPTTSLVMMTDDTEALVYAMKRSPRIGWRRDSLGWDTNHFGKIEADSVRWNAIKDRWKTAIVVTEFCNPRYQDDPEVYQQALEEVRRYHISLVSNANTLSWSSLSDTGKNAFLLLGKSAGYRLALNELSLPTTIDRGVSFSINTRWTNVGVAPIYERWKVAVQFRKSGESAVAWETNSSIELDDILPIYAVSHADSAVLPTGLERGTYDVVIVIKDPRRYRAPLALAVTGIRSDGSYRLGTVTVR